MTHAILFNFDTLRYANELKAAGVPEKQAEVQARKLAETIEEQNKVIVEWIDDSLATKLDLKNLEIRLGKIIIGTGIGVVTILGVVVPVIGKLLGTH